MDAKEYMQQYRKICMLADIEALPAAEYAVLHCLYVQGLSLQEAADQAGRSYAWAALTHRTALDSLQKILDEETNTERNEHGQRRNQN